MKPSWLDMLRVWGRIGLMSFGGPAAQIALMQREVVDKQAWLGEGQFLNALSFCMLLPGPEAMQLATYIGWRLRGVGGGLLSGLFFIMPGALLVSALSIIYVYHGSTFLMQSLFLGVKAAIIVIVFAAVFAVAQRSLTSRSRWFMAFAAFVALFFLNIPFPVVILVAGLYGYIFFKKGNVAIPVPANEYPCIQSTRAFYQTVFLWLSLWWIPLLMLHLWADQPRLIDIGIFFSKLASVTFGGAYAVLTYMAQDVVQNKAWLSATEMMDGLGMAETTPGPLILVTSFVGFLSGARMEVGEINIVMGLVAVAVTLWVTFVPCFLWVFALSPYFEWLATKKRLSSALSAISAAVVGVILNLSIWFALHLIFDQLSHYDFGPLTILWPEFETLNLGVIGLIGFAFLLRIGLKQGIVTTLFACAGLSSFGNYLFQLT